MYTDYVPNMINYLSLATAWTTGVQFPIREKYIHRHKIHSGSGFHSLSYPGDEMGFQN
jgi:hypothetical protein